MRQGSISVDKVLQTIEKMSLEDQQYISEILSRRLIERRREEIAKRAREAMQAYREGRVKRGTVQDLWEDLND